MGEPGRHACQDKAPQLSDWVVYGVNEVRPGDHREMPVWGRALARHRSRWEAWARTQCTNLVAFLEYIQDHPPVMAKWQDAALAALK